MPIRRSVLKVFPFLNNNLYIQNVHKVCTIVNKIMTESWIDKMIEREATPKSLRKDTVEQFCAKYGISESTYYYQSNKTDNWKKVLEISLMSAKKEVPDVLKVLGEKAKSGDVKAINTYLDYVVQLSRNLDIKSDGKSLVINVDKELVGKYGLDSSTTGNS